MEPHRIMPALPPIPRLRAVLLALGFLWSTGAIAAPDAVRISGAWVRATVPGQPVAGAYLDLEAPAGAWLIAIASPVAARGEVHAMKEEGGMMTMRAVGELALPPGTVVKLAPGGLHIMLFDLQRSLAAGSEVPLTLTFRNTAGRRFKQTVVAPVKAQDEAPSRH